MNKEQLKKDNIKNYYKNKIIITNYHNEIKDNIIKRIFNNVSKRICKKLKCLHINRNYTYKELLGCDLLEFEFDLISKLKDGMTLDNYCEWEIDHIKACSNFDLTKLEEQKQCFHYTNLQPLFKTTEIAEKHGYINEIGNRNKGNKSY